MHISFSYDVIRITLEQLSRFFLRFRPVHYKKGEMVLRPEEDLSGVFYLSLGYVRSYSVSEEGKEFTLNIFKPGSYFPASWFLAGVKNLYFFEAMTDVEIRKAPVDKTLSFIKENPDILFDLTKRVLIGMSGLLIRMEHLLSKKASSKVASALYLCARRFGKMDTGGLVIDLPLTHQDIADLAALTRETTSLEMKKLERKGLITKKKHLLVIKDMKKLKDVSLIFFGGRPLPYIF